MKLRYLEVQNYRSIRKAKKLELSDSTTIVGSNNEGKSNLVRALECAISTLQVANHLKAKTSIPWKSDAFQRILGKQLYQLGIYRIERDFPRSLSPTSKADTILRLTFELSEQECDEFETKFESKINSSLPIEVKIDPRLNLVERPEYPTVQINYVKPGPGKAKIEQHLPDVLSYIMQNFSFASSDAVRPGERGVDELQALLKERLVYLAKNDDDYKAAVQTMTDFRAKVIDEVTSDFEATLSDFLPDLESISIEPTEMIESQLKAIEVSMSDGVNTKLSEKGDGVQSLFTLALLQHKASFSRSVKGQDLLTIIEEPEAHLNSKTMYEIRKVLEKIAASQQVIVVIHNAIFVDRKNPSSNILVDEGAARNADSIGQIRDALGITSAEAMNDVELKILVEGETDRAVFSEIINRSNLENLKKAIKLGRIELVATKGIKFLENHLRIAENTLTNVRVLADYDATARKKLESSPDLIDISEYAYIRHPRSKGRADTDATLEDIYPVETLVKALRKTMGVAVAPEIWESCKPTPAIERAQELSYENNKRLEGAKLEEFKRNAADIFCNDGEYRQESVDPVLNLLAQVDDDYR